MRKKKDKAQIITPSQSYFATKKKKLMKVYLVSSTFITAIFIAKYSITFRKSCFSYF